jgi:sec-independent protein translocase protein TatB
MLDFDAGKLIIVGIIALIFIPPKDLPRVLRQAGQLVGRMRRMASEFQGQFMDAMREADMEDLRKEAQKLADGAKAQMGLGEVDAHNRSIMQAIERRDAVHAEPKLPEPEPVAPAPAPHETASHEIASHEPAAPQNATKIEAEHDKPVAAQST